MKKFSAIKGSNNWVEIHPLNKGFSADEKYIITDCNNQKYILRIFNISLFDVKKEQFNLIKEINESLDCFSKVIDFGMLDNEKGYLMFLYIDGEDCKKYIECLSDEESYKLGIEAGKILKKIHQINVKTPTKEWYDEYCERIELKIKYFNELGINIPKKDMIIDYLRDNKHLLKDRERTITHGDFQLSNLLIKDGKINVIDLEKVSLTDPYQDFRYCILNLRVGDYFQTGMVNGYFDNQIPNDFFPILKLYVVETLITQIPWAMGVSEEEVKLGYDLFDAILYIYDDLRLDIPLWYRRVNFE